MPFEARRGPGRPKKDEPETTHVIHDDGSYSNQVNTKQVKFDRSQLYPGRFISVGGEYPVAGWVYHVDQEGIRIRTIRHREPDLSECPYRTWEYVESNLTEKL